MNAFQVDENINDRKLIRGCNRAGLCSLKGFPTELRGLKDHRMLPALLSNDAPLITSDFTLIEENARHVPAFNAGVIVPRSKNPRQTQSTRFAAGVLQTFKGKFPEWPNAVWANLYVELYEDSVSLEPLPARPGHGRVTFQLDATFDAAAFAAAMRQAAGGGPTGPAASTPPTPATPAGEHG